MANWDDVRRFALALPETSERLSRNLQQWRVKEKLFIWERPLRQSDLAALGTRAPEGPILGARVADLDEKDERIASNPRFAFTIAHFNGYPAILVRLDEISSTDLRAVILEAWMARAPARLVKDYVNRL